MAKRKAMNETKMAIIREGTGMFLETGYSHTTIKAIGEKLKISTGNITFYFPAKEHLLAVLVEWLCDFQWKMMNADGQSSQMMALSMELMAMAAICEEDEIAKDFYISAYTHPVTLEIIRKSDCLRAKAVFADYCGDWTDEQFAEAQVLVSGIEYATLMVTGESPSLEVRIAGALEQIMAIYGVPKITRKRVIRDVMKQDYRGVGRRILAEFKHYVDEMRDSAG